MNNKAIAQQFENLTASLQIIDAKKYFFQIRSYQRVIQLLHDLPQEISEIYREKKDLEFLEGIGPAIEKKIIELLETGTCQEIEHITKKMPAGMFPLLEIAGVGAKRAYKLATTFHITNPNTAVDTLDKLAKEGKIRELETFGEKSELDIIENISRLRNSVQSMPFETAHQIAQDLIEFIKKDPSAIDVIPLGSLRRMKKEVGDIDLGVSTNNFESVKKHVKNYPQLQRILAQGSNLMRLLLKGNIQVDLKSSPSNRWGAFSQHFTGSKDHNIKLREYALKQGKSLSEHGIKLVDENEATSKKIKNTKSRPNSSSTTHITDRRDNRLLEFSNEKDFYNFLGLKYIPPEKRIGKDEILKAKLERRTKD